MKGKNVNRKFSKEETDDPRQDGTGVSGGNVGGLTGKTCPQTAGMALCRKKSQNLF